MDNYYNYYRYYPHYSNPKKPNAHSELHENEKPENKLFDREIAKTSSKYNSFANFHLSNLFYYNSEEPVLEILGFKLYLDDIIIICLLYILYTEGVQDEFLFIILVLLLFS